jgi:hypothetical protein
MALDVNPSLVTLKYALTVIEFVCDISVFGTGMPRLIAQLPPGDDEDACAFVLEWRQTPAYLSPLLLLS